jgi:NADPH:quinone reductase-like Zn-dependent oxidoreductase
MGASIDMEKAKELGVSGIAQSTHTRTEVLERLASLIDEGKIKVEIDKEFSLDEVKEGFDYLEKDHPKGKVVISIK